MSERLHPSDFLTDYEISQAGERLQAAARAIERHYVGNNPDPLADNSIGMLTFSKVNVPALGINGLEVRFKDQKVAQMTLYSGWPEGFNAYFKDGAFHELDTIDPTKGDHVSRTETDELLSVVKIVCASL
jgi:hypothetical protein